MGSVSSSLNPGVANLLQTLADVNSPVLSSPATVSALETASPTDIVQLSESATQLENVDALFGISNSSSDSGASILSNLLANLESTETGTGASASSVLEAATTPQSSAATTTATQADQLASYQAALQSAETQTLLGTGSTPNLSDSSLINLLG